MAANLWPQWIDFVDAAKGDQNSCIEQPNKTALTANVIDTTLAGQIVVRRNGSKETTQHTKSSTISNPTLLHAKRLQPVECKANE